MPEHEWIKEFPAAITVCDTEGIILEMNDKAAKTFEKDGGYKLVGSNMLDCHPDPAREKDRKAAGRTNQKCIHHRKERSQKTHLSISVV
ncbi:hypothetical protein [Candidatus Villigracilis proximus]|uniref:hypothetical protein n=1 Tax=Candidatus Villigracilis proximus TaxID=3140683 RepID=UPI0031E6ECE1